MATARETTSAQPQRRVRRLRHGPVTREQILDSSLRLFSEKGFARTSVRDIAQAAGITDAAIYYHFASKRDLFEALIEERGFTQALANLETAEITVGPDEAIPGIASNALAFIYTNRDLMKVLMVEAMSGDSVATEEYQMLVERFRNGVARILRHYEEQRVIRPVDVGELANQLVNTVIGPFADYMMSSTTALSEESVPPELKRHVEVAVQHILQGIRQPE